MCAHMLSTLQKKRWWAENTGKHVIWSLVISIEIFCSNKSAMQPVRFFKECVLFAAKSESNHTSSDNNNQNN